MTTGPRVGRSVSVTDDSCKMTEDERASRLSEAGSSLRKFYYDNPDLAGSLNVSFKDEQGATGKPFLTTLPRSRVAAATETNVDRRTTAVMAHAQLKGVVEGVCAASVVAESLASLDPLRLEGMGVAPNDAVRLYKAVYKYARVSVASLGEARDALQEMGHGGDDANARGELLGHLWHLYASAWEGACGESFPSRVVQAKALAPALRDARNAVEVLTSDLETTKQALLSLEEEALEAQVEADALRPSVREAETQRARAENAERLLLAASARGDAFQLELATTSVTLQRVLGELDAAKVASCESEKRLSADALDAAKAAKAELAATLEKNAFDLIAPHKALADTVLQRDAALAGERDAKKVTSVLKADVAFLREKRSGAHDELHVALLRAREAEDRQDVSVRVAKTAKHEASVAVEKCAVAENSASGLRENVSGLEKELTLAKTELHQLKQKVNLLEGEDVRVQLKLAKGRAELAERELGEAKQTRTKAVDRCKQLVTDMERADKERRSALRVAKKAETFALELEKKVLVLADEKAVLANDLAHSRETVATLEARVGELGALIAAAEAEVTRLGGALAAETAAKAVALAKTKSLREMTVATIATLDTKSERPFALLETLASSVDGALSTFDAKFSELENEIATFTETKVATLTTTELALQKWTGEVSAVSRVAMDKANGAVAMLVTTIKRLNETEAQLVAAEEELDITKQDFTKTAEELVTTAAELVKTKSLLDTSQERTRALETSTAEMNTRLTEKSTLLDATTRERNTERSGRLQANLAKSVFRVLKNKFQADAENAGEALVDAGEALEHAKTSRAIAHVNAAQAKIRLALLKNSRKLSSVAGGETEETEEKGPDSYFTDSQIMDGTPGDLVPYQQMLTGEYHALSVALKKKPEEEGDAHCI